MSREDDQTSQRGARVSRPVVEGVFAERPGDPHVRARRELLDGRSELPAPDVPVRTARANDFPNAGGGALLAGLGRRGLAVAALDRPLTNDRFLALGALLGRAMPETDPSVRPYVEDDVILNLVTEHEATPDVALQPFAASPLTLHSEGSGRPAAGQPRYIVLMCLEPGAATGTQTVLVPMADVARRLTPAQADVLSRTRYRRNERGPAILRYAGGRPVFSFRDFGSQPLEWTHTGGAGAAEVDKAIRALLAAMYTGGAAGTRWRPGSLVVIDNTFLFHGRTAGLVDPSVPRRHLRRLRIVA